MQRVVDILTMVSIPTEGVTDNASIMAAVKAKNPALLGKSEVDEAAVVQWLVYSEQQFSLDVMKKLDEILSDKSYLVGQRLSLADVAVVWAITSNNVSMDNTTNISRWFAHTSCCLSSTKTMKLSQPIVPMPLPVFIDTANTNKPVEGKKTEEEQKAIIPTESDIKDDKKDDKKIEKKEDSSASKNEKKSVADVGASTSDELDPSKLDIRVGVVVKCWNHPDSEKLLCEEIDLGEGSNRLIASGIRAHYSAEDVQGRKVMVLSNLKERSIAGFKSQGMVLCASNQDHSIVRLLEPPVTASIGDRVVFNGFSGEAATPAQVAKKKIFESLAPFLRTDSNGVAHWKNASFLIGGQPCKAPVPDAIVA